nr:alpha-2-macroglobulin [Raoultella sp. NCTC 9187]
MTIIAQQAQPVTLDDKGEGTVTLPIGDFNGELRVMAQAWTADDFGSSEDKVVVAAPVIAELNTPRFLASGDTTRLALDLSNLTDRPANPERRSERRRSAAACAAGNPAGSAGAGARRTLFVPVSAKEGLATVSSVRPSAA